MEKCNHDQKKLIKFRCSNDVYQYRDQCQVCGKTFTCISKESLMQKGIDLKSLPEKDHQLEYRYRKKLNNFYDQERARHRANFFNRYDKYLKSWKWEEKRQKVFKRTNGLCEGCCMNPATQVHHESYANIGDELLFQLRAVCSECHNKLHNPIPWEELKL